MTLVYLSLHGAVYFSGTRGRVIESARELLSCYIEFIEDEIHGKCLPPLYSCRHSRHTYIHAQASGFPHAEYKHYLQSIVTYTALFQGVAVTTPKFISKCCIVLYSIYTIKTRNRENAAGQNESFSATVLWTNCNWTNEFLIEMRVGYHWLIDI